MTNRWRCTPTVQCRRVRCRVQPCKRRGIMHSAEEMKSYCSVLACTWRFGARSERQHVGLSGRKHRRGRERQGHSSGQAQPQDVLCGVRLHRQGAAAYVTWNRQTSLQSLMVEPGAKGLSALEEIERKTEGKQTVSTTVTGVCLCPITLQ